MQDDIDILPNLTIPGWEVWYSTARAGGAGGQHVNKTSSAVTLHWIPGNSSVLSTIEKQRVAARLATRLTLAGELQVHSEDERSQLRNREIVRERFAEILRSALHQQRKRRPTKPTRGSIHARLADKKVHATRKSGRRKLSLMMKTDTPVRGYLRKV